jgi:hypothetical protein
MNTSEGPIASTTTSVLLLTLFALACSVALNIVAIDLAGVADAPSAKVDPRTLVAAAEAADVKIAKIAVSRL